MITYRLLRPREQSLVLTRWQQRQQWQRPSHAAPVASGVAAGDCHGSGARCGGSDRGGSGGGAQSPRSEPGYGRAGWLLAGLLAWLGSRACSLRPVVAAAVLLQLDLDSTYGLRLYSVLLFMTFQPTKKVVS